MNKKLDPNISCPTFEEPMTEFDEELAIQKDTQSKSKKRGFAVWFISGLLHLVVVGILTLIIVAQNNKKEDVIITTSIIPVEEEKLDETKEITLVKVKTEVNVKETTDVPMLTQTEEQPAEQVETANEMETASAEGVSEAISDSPQVGSGLMGNIGGGGGGGGAFGQRTGGGKKRAVVKNGGSKKTEAAVDAGLMWLANHQEKDGHWDAIKYEGASAEGAGPAEVDSAATGAALLAFLGAGHTDRTGPWKNNVKTAISWLISTQKPDGSWGLRNYSNGICTMAIAEAAGMGCGGSPTKKSAELAVDYLLKQQNTSGGFDYKGPSNRDDMSLTGWCIMGLKSALLAGIRENDIKEAFIKCGNLLDNMHGTKDNTSSTKGYAWYDNRPEGNGNGGWASAGSACQAIAMLVRQYLGWHRSEPWLMAAAQSQVSKIPVDYSGLNVYRAYYSFLTLFQQGGKDWTTWNEPVSKIVVAAQRQDGDFKGSWDKNGLGHLDFGGRVMYTAFLCLSLEIYYRYESVMKH